MCLISTNNIATSWMPVRCYGLLILSRYTEGRMFLIFCVTNLFVCMSFLSFVELIISILFHAWSTKKQTICWILNYMWFYQTCILPPTTNTCLGQDVSRYKKESVLNIFLTNLFMFQDPVRLRSRSRGHAHAVVPRVWWSIRCCVERSLSRRNSRGYDGIAHWTLVAPSVV
jgi:hypothetical protein